MSWFAFIQTIVLAILGYVIASDLIRAWFEHSALKELSIRGNASLFKKE